MNSVKDLAKKIKRHWTNILNTIEHGLSSAKCESVNNTIKLILRRAYGFHNLQNMTDMIMLCCSDLKVVLPGDVCQPKPPLRLGYSRLKGVPVTHKYP